MLIGFEHFELFRGRLRMEVKPQRGRGARAARRMGWGEAEELSNIRPSLLGSLLK